MVADWAELKSSVANTITEQTVSVLHHATDGGASKLHKLVHLSAAMPTDAAFARQARRKYF